MTSDKFRRHSDRTTVFTLPTVIDIKMNENIPPAKRARCDNPYNNPDFGETLLHWFQHSSDEEVDDNVYEEEHDTNSEHEDENQSSEEDDKERIETKFSASENYYGKNKYKWSCKSLIESNIQEHEKLNHPSLMYSANLAEIVEPITIWSSLFSEDMLQVILLWTNMKIQSTREMYKNTSKSDVEDMDIDELKAFIGLLFYTAVFNSNRENIERIFATDGTGREIFRCVMSRNRFAFLLVCLRFDNSVGRIERQQIDPVAPISEIFNKFLSNCQSVYTPSLNMCIDEMLVAFRGKCRLKMYMPNKPCKYGIKIMCMTDMQSHYFYNGYIYCGKNSESRTSDENVRKLSRPTQAVLRLVAPVENTNRNIVSDNRFTSIELLEALREKGLTYIGTIKKNKKEIPQQFLPNRNRSVGSTLFGFTKHATLVSHIPKKQDGVLLLSSMHHTESHNSDTGESEIITYYNIVKDAINGLNEMCTEHITSRRTERWSMAIFFRLLDISGINAYVLYQTCESNPKISERTEFLKQLAEQLVKPQLQKRALNLHLKRQLRETIRTVLRIPDENLPIILNEKLEKRKTCYSCPSRLRRKTSYICHICQRPICLECSSKCCQECRFNV